MQIRKLGTVLALTVAVSFGTYTLGATLDRPGFGLNKAQGEAVINGPADLKGSQNVAHSPYFKKLDIYNMKSKGSLTVLNHFPTLQQSTEYTCGPAAALMVVKYFKPEVKADKEMEMAMAKAMSTSSMVGTNTRGMVKYFSKDKWKVESALTDKSPQTDEEFKSFIVDHLKNNMPVMVENIDWGGHWRVIIGYDDMGTKTVGDDVLLVADPYDTTDHNQDGYGIVPAQRFYYMWFDAKLFSKGEQERQWLSVRPL